MVDLIKVPSSLINEEFVDELLLKFQTKEISTNSSNEKINQDSESSQEFSGMKLWDISSSIEGASMLMERNVVDICSSIISSGNNVDRIVELASGILANLAVHKQLRSSLANNNKLLIDIRDTYLICSDPPSLLELTRMFSSLLRPVKQEEEEEDGNTSSCLHDVLCGILSKSAWIIHNCLDIGVLGQTSEFLLLLFYYEYELFKCLVKDNDCKLAEGIAEMSNNYLNEFQTLPEGSRQAGYVVDLMDIIADELEDGSSGLVSLYAALPSLAECVIAQSLPLNIVYKSVVCLSRLHKDATKGSIEMPVDNELATSLLKLLQIKSMLSSVGDEVVGLLEYQLKIEKSQHESTNNSITDNNSSGPSDREKQGGCLHTLIQRHSDDINKVLDSRDEPIQVPRLVALALGRCAGAKRRDTE